MIGRRGARSVFVAGTVLLAALVAVAHRVALDDLRDVEARHVQSRQATACAIQELAPFARGVRGLEVLDETVAELVSETTTEVERLRVAFRAQPAGWSPWPGVRRARAAVRRALDGQVELYRAMRDDPGATADELAKYGPLNSAAERAITTARRNLFVSPGAGWNGRAVCRRPPPDE